MIGTGASPCLLTGVAYISAGRPRAGRGPRLDRHSQPGQTRRPDWPTRPSVGCAPARPVPSRSETGPACPWPAGPVFIVALEGIDRVRPVDATPVCWSKIRPSLKASAEVLQPLGEVLTNKPAGRSCVCQGVGVAVGLAVAAATDLVVAGLGRAHRSYDSHAMQGTFSEPPPPRLSRWRELGPLLVSSGATPTGGAKAASLRTQPRWDQLISSCAATTGQVLLEGSWRGDLHVFGGDHDQGLQLGDRFRDAD